MKKDAILRKASKLLIPWDRSMNMSTVVLNSGMTFSHSRKLMTILEKKGVLQIEEGKRDKTLTLTEKGKEVRRRLMNIDFVLRGNVNE